MCDGPRRIEGLNALTKLRKLVLTNNSIRRVENLQQLQTLEHLLLQGNEISSLDDLNLPLLVRPAALSLLPAAPVTPTSRS